MSKVIKAVSIAAFKELVNTVSISVRKSRKGSIYGVNEHDDLVCWFAPDIDLTKEITVLKQTEGGESWWFAINGTPGEGAEELAVL